MEQEIPEANGGSMHSGRNKWAPSAKDLLTELNKTTDGRRRGEIRRQQHSFKNFP